MRVENTFHINASPDVVWPIIADVATWSSWTKSITSVHLLDSGPFAVGTKAEVRQPGMPAATWTVTELVPGESFTWQANNTGLVSTGVHSVRAAADGGADATLVFEQRGALAWLMALLFGGKCRRFVQMEADGLTQRSEAS
ncbi:MAG: polyketide cyclase [Ilumatobacteraceae bacterium]|nr:polyketide cyclase [Ilumatobacteraceae bacterium]